VALASNVITGSTVAPLSGPDFNARSRSSTKATEKRPLAQAPASRLGPVYLLGLRMFFACACRFPPI
jgi:hypothetical protein